jgi:hypothetical protein
MLTQSGQQERFWVAGGRRAAGSCIPIRAGARDYLPARHALGRLHTDYQRSNTDSQPVLRVGHLGAVALVGFVSQDSTRRHPWGGATSRSQSSRALHHGGSSCLVSRDHQRWCWFGCMHSVSTATLHPPSLTGRANAGANGMVCGQVQRFWWTMVCALPFLAV